MGMVSPASHNDLPLHPHIHVDLQMRQGPKSSWELSTPQKLGSTSYPKLFLLYSYFDEYHHHLYLKSEI